MKKLQRQLNVAGSSYLVEAYLDNGLAHSCIFEAIPGSKTDFQPGYVVWAGVKKENLINLPASVLRANSTLLERIRK